MKKPLAGKARSDRFVFRLYVAGDAPRSVRAIENLRELCKRHIGDAFEVNVVDVMREPLRALEDGIMLTPTLVKVSPPPVHTLIGDLSEEVVTLAALGFSAPGAET